MGRAFCTFVRELESELLAPVVYYRYTGRLWRTITRATDGRLASVHYSPAITANNFELRCTRAVSGYTRTDKLNNRPPTIRRQRNPGKRS